MKYEIITSKDNKKIKELAAFSPKSDFFIAEGFHLVEMALETDSAEAIFSLKEYESNVTTYLVNEEVMKKISFTMNPEGILAKCPKKNPKPISSNKILILDGVSDPGNVGTLIRTALSFGYFDIALSRGSVDPYNPKCVQASQGAIFKTNIIKGIDSSFLKELKKQGYKVIGTSLKSSISLSSINKEEKIAIILGNEARGISEAFEKDAVTNVKIEMDNIDSLNVAIAGGIIMYELR